jgi:hypothetical protein
MQRCEVGRAADGTVELTATALVGPWPEYKLPRRNPIGTIDSGDAASEVLRRLAVPLPPIGRVVEAANGFDSPEAQRARALTPVSLTVPPMSAEQARSAWDAWLLTHVSALMQQGAAASEVIDAMEVVVAARAVPWPNGQPTVAVPRHESLF